MSGIRYDNGAVAVWRAFGLLCFVFLVYSHTMAWLIGRDQEAKLTLDAYHAAERAKQQLARYVPVGENALAVCLATDAALHELLLDSPVPFVWTEAGP